MSAAWAIGAFAAAMAAAAVIGQLLPGFREAEALAAARAASEVREP